ncbi:MAG: hypothetical protein M1818_002668 [Claussenomyces sp. TS43310]|nr:MAG: hypothetical protein M1818_002668 [Claussenomyces sp. TS43310]
MADSFSEPGAHLSQASELSAFAATEQTSRMIKVEEVSPTDELERIPRSKLDDLNDSSRAAAVGPDIRCATSSVGIQRVFNDRPEGSPGAGSHQILSEAASQIVPAPKTITPKTWADGDLSRYLYFNPSPPPVDTQTYPSIVKMAETVASVHNPSVREPGYKVSQYLPDFKDKWFSEDTTPTFVVQDIVDTFEHNERRMIQRTLESAQLIEGKRREIAELQAALKSAIEQAQSSAVGNPTVESPAGPRAASSKGTRGEREFPDLGYESVLRDHIAQVKRHTAELMLVQCRCAIKSGKYDLGVQYAENAEAAFELLDGQTLNVARAMFWRGVAWAGLESWDAALQGFEHALGMGLSAASDCDEGEAVEEWKARCEREAQP